MEIVGAISEGEWNTFNGMCSEEADFMAQLLGNSLLPVDVPSSSDFALSSFWPNHEPHNGVVGVKESATYSSGETNTNINCLSQGNGYSGGSSDFFLPSNFESYHPCGSQQVLLTNRNPMTMDSCMISGMNYSYCAPLLANDVMEGDDFLNHYAGNGSTESDKKLSEDVLQGKTFQVGGETLKEDKPSCPSYISKKRARVPGDLPKAKRSPGSKKGVKIEDKDGDNNTNTVLNRQSSSSCCSEDDSIASHDMTRVTTSSTSKGSGTVNLNGKTRAIRGSATDPQSLYARKRRERINERLRILQNLVPNGTKVDISTMLEEAVQYVKFLQLQIKLLSSDDLWMYAPIAYNGMDIEALNS